MLIPKKNRVAIYSLLFKEGVLAVRKAAFQAKHHYIEVPNLQVMAAMKTLKSKGAVIEQFAWQWFYYTLTDEGIEYLRDYLHIPAETLPDTHKKPETSPIIEEPRRGQRREGGRSGYRGGEGQRG
eukprot:305173_1